MDSRHLILRYTLALELDDAPPSTWDRVLARYSQTNGVEFYLFDEDGEPVAGPELQLLPEVVAKVPRNQRPRGGPPQEQNGARRGGESGGVPPLFLTATSSPTRYWAGVRIPVRRDRTDRPKPRTPILMSSSLVASQLFFDPKPWLAVVLAVILNT